MLDTVREILASIDSSGAECDTDVDAVIERISALVEDPLFRLIVDRLLTPRRSPSCR